MTSQITENHTIVRKVGPRRLPKYTLKSMHHTSCPQCVHRVCLWTPGLRKWCPRYPKWNLKVSKMTVLRINSDPFQQSTCQQFPASKWASGRGEALRFGAPLAEGLQAVMGSQPRKSFKKASGGTTFCRRPLTGTSLAHLENHRNLGHQKKRSRAPKWTPF